MTSRSMKHDSRMAGIVASSNGQAYVAPKYDITTVKDGAFHVFSSQIAENYVQMLRKHVLPYLEYREGLRLRELRMLNCIFRYESGLQASDIVAIMRYDPATVSRALKRLKDHDMVIKSASQDDARALVLNLTEKGRALASEYRSKSLQVYNFLSELVGIKIPMEDMEQFLRTAELIKARTTAMGQVHPKYVEKFLEETQETYGQVLKMTAF